MKKNLLVYSLLISMAIQARETPYDYIFFTNSRMSVNYFYSSVNFQAPSLVIHVNKKLPVSELFFHTPGNALQLEFVNGKKGKWQASVFKQQVRGQDHFKTAKFLSFWLSVTSDKTNLDNLPAVQLMKRDSTLSGKSFIEGINIKSWNRILIPVDQFSGMDFSNPENTIAVVFSQKNEDGKKHTIYIDDIEFTSYENKALIKAVPAIQSLIGYSKHVDIQWKPVSDTAVKLIKIYRSESGGKFLPVGIQSATSNRFADYTGLTGVAYQYKISFLDLNYNETNSSRPAFVQTKTMSDDELLSMVQEACFRYYWEGAEKTSGLAKENIMGRRNMVATGASGFGMMALVAGTERKFISREMAVARYTQIVNFLEKAQTFHGAFPHFIDGPTGKVEPFFGSRDNGGDLVETSFLVQGLLTAKAFFDKNNLAEKTIRDKITKIWHRIEWDWYKQNPGSKFLYWHWSPDKGWIVNHRLIGWNETMATYLLALSSPTHPVPASFYYSGWASQDNFAKQYRKNWGGTDDGSDYTNGKTYFDIKLDVGVSNGGPLFFTHYSYLGFDPHLITDKYTNYFTNNKNIALINYRYCLQNPNQYAGYGDSCWGLTASDGPFRYSADAPVQRQDRGKIAPTGAISSFPYTPEESMKALKNYYFNYGKFLWGEYGFRDAFNLSENWCSEIYMGLNQAPMVVMIENYRSGLLWKLFMRNHEISKGLIKLEAETKKQ
ncbi:MAG: glucoamylase family protein [Chitinophagaceae bacterium]